MSRRFRVAVIGAGIGAAHVEAYRDNAQGYEVAAICDLDAGRAGALAATVPGAVVETSYDAVLARSDIDLVDICLPPYLHLDTIEAALAAGKHVLCEKPLVGSLAQVERVMRAAERAGRTVVPVYQYRYGNGLARLRRLIEAGVTGRPLVASIETHWNRLPEYYDVPLARPEGDRAGRRHARPRDPRARPADLHAGAGAPGVRQGRHPGQRDRDRGLRGGLPGDGVRRAGHVLGHARRGGGD